MGLNHLWKAISFFGVWGGFYGFVCGLIAGSLIVPVAGWIYSVPHGTGIGLTLGVVIGIVTGIVDLMRINNLHLQSYRRRKVIVTGLFTAVVAPLLVYLISENILWCRSVTLDACYPGLEELLVPVLIQAAFWGGLSSAYVAHRFNNRDVEFEETLVYDQLKFWTNYLLRWWLFHLIMGAYVAALLWINLPDFYSNLPLNELIPRILEIFVLTWGASALIVMPFLGYVFSILLMFLNNIFFQEYLPGLTVAAYKNIVTLLTILLTLGFGLTLVNGLLFPLAIPVAVAMGITARAYGDWYWSANRSKKKKVRDTETEELEADELADDPFEDPLILDASDNLRSLES